MANRPEQHVDEHAMGDAPVVRRSVARRGRIDPAEIADRLVKGDRAALARAISLIESSTEKHRPLAEQLLERVLPRTGNAVRVGITGVPGVGKSTFIECLGSKLTSGAYGQEEMVAVLAIDPSSTVTGGSILGDKTRMPILSGDPRAFIRPSPSAGTLGGVARRSRETMLLCEAAGYSVVLVETVGVGQSETLVTEMTDFCLALMLPGAGDELQGIKRGLLELADLVAVNKADGENVRAAKRAAMEHEAALRCMPRDDDAWRPSVLSCSAQTGQGVERVWMALLGRWRDMESGGLLAARRTEQQIRWYRQLVQERLQSAFEHDQTIRAMRDQVEADVRDGVQHPARAAAKVVDQFLSNRDAQS